MAASGFTPISLYYSTTPSAIPTAGNLVPGELGLNIADMKLYCENSSGVVTLLADAARTGTVTSVSGTGTVNGITLTGTVTSSGNLTLGGTLSGVSLSTQVTGTLPIANGGSGQTTAQAAMNAFAGATTSGSYLRGNGTNVVMSTIQAGDVPTLNQNTTGSAATLTTARTFQTNLASTSAASFNGSANVTPGVTGTLPVGNGGTGATTLTGVLKGNGTSAFSAATAGTDFVAPGTATTFTAKQTFNGSSSVAAAEFTNIIEDGTVAASAATGTINFDVLTQSVLYYTSNATGNWTLNVRGSSGTTLSSLLDVGDSVVVTFLVTNGATAYYQTAFQVDGSSVTPKWQGGTAPTAGNANSIDAYTVAIIKTAATPTYTAFASVTKFA